MALWRKFGSAGFESLIYRCKRWHSVLPSGGAPSTDCVIKLRQSRFFENPFSDGGSIFSYTQSRSFVASAQVKTKPTVEGKVGGWRKPNVENDAGIRINEAIKEHEVRLVSDQGHRIVSIQEALYLARKLDLDLVEVQRKVKVEGGAPSPVFKPAVCKLMNYYKEKYKRDVRGKERAKSKSATALRNGENKEVRFKAKTELKDLKIKAESVKRLMERGYRVKCTAMPTGKEDEDLGGLLLSLLSLIEDISVVESGPHLDTKNAYVIVKHIKFSSKKGKKVSKAMETVSSVLSTRSNADNNNSGKDEKDLQTEEEEEEWETVESDSDTEIDDLSIKMKTNTQHLLSSHFVSPLKVVSHRTNDHQSDIGFNAKRTSSEEGINKSNGRNAAGFLQSQPAPSTEINRYSKGSSNNTAFHQVRPANRDPFFSRKVENGNQGRIPERTGRHESEIRGQPNPNFRPARINHPDSPSPRYGVFNASPSSNYNDKSNASAPNASQQRYGVFNSTKSSPPVERVGKSSSSTSSYGIFSTPKKIFSDDKTKLSDASRGNSIGEDQGFIKTGKPSDANPPSPRFGIFTSSKKTSSGDGCVGEKN